MGDPGGIEVNRNDPGLNNNKTINPKVHTDAQKPDVSIL